MEFVRLDVADAVATIRLERPKMNALNRQMQAEIGAAAAECAHRGDIRAVVVYGGEKVFAAGADIKEMDAMSFADMAAHSRDLQAAFTGLARVPKPVVAAITGYALGGGCELALCCDFRVVAEDAKLGQPEIRLGIIPGAGGTQRLTRLVGPAKAKDIVFSGRQVDAAEALAIGLADRVVPASDVYETAHAWAATFASGPAVALAAAKDAIDRGLEVDLDTGLEIERAQFAGLFATEDKRTGFQAFIEKTKPAFGGR
jgi:enoyl-CoA hydratase/carnithine racemase